MKPVIKPLPSRGLSDESAGLSSSSGELRSVHRSGSLGPESSDKPRQSGLSVGSKKTKKLSAGGEKFASNASVQAGKGRESPLGKLVYVSSVELPCFSFATKIDCLMFNNCICKEIKKKIDV